MTTIADIRAGLAANLAAVQDAHGKPQISAYRQPAPVLPSIQVTGFDEMTQTTFVGGYSIPMIVQAFAGLTSSRGAQELLDGWLFPQDGVWAAIESDRDLGGKVDDLAVTRCDGTQIARLDDSTEVLMATWHVQIEI